MSSDHWLKVANVLQALLTPFIGIATIVLGVVTVVIQRRQAETARRQTDIAQQQALTNALQLRLAIFERRMKICDATMEVIAAVVREAEAELNDLFEFLRKTRDHEFLFGPEVGKYINDLYNKGVDLHTRRALDARERKFDRETELLTWFAEQLKTARQVFLPYIDFRQP